MCDDIFAKEFKKNNLPSPSISYKSSIVTDNVSFSESIVEITNKRRARHGANPVSWNSNLADDALNWAKNCFFEHSSYDYGENLALGGLGQSGASLADRWYSEEACKYDYNKPGFSLKDTGHFSQVLWKGTTQIGCALVTKNDHCPNGIPYDNTAGGRSADAFLVCEYYPQGNFRGQYPNNVAIPDPPFQCSGNKLLN